MSEPTVIDWDEAMQQCGEDEEFLRELLADLRSETDTQMAKIEETIQVGVFVVVRKNACVCYVCCSVELFVCAFCYKK